MQRVKISRLIYDVRFLYFSKATGGGIGFSGQCLHQRLDANEHREPCALHAQPLLVFDKHVADTASCQMDCVVLMDVEYGTYWRAQNKMRDCIGLFFAKETEDSFEVLVFCTANKE